jgi:1-deoxy-D-xylulose-5-phosphate reductoisomerase
MKNVVLLGSTGSIGTSTLKVVEDLPAKLRLIGLAAGSNADLLAEQALRHHPLRVSIQDPAKAPALAARLPGIPVATGDAGLLELAVLPEAHIVLIAIVGTAGLAPALAAIRAGKDIAVASKEILVMAGGIVMDEARRNRVRVLAVDSEHSAIFQCLEDKPAGSVRNLWLTASGGPFRDRSTWPIEALAQVTLEQALKHPSWVMGRKISVDSATMMNKELEVIEAHWLFGLAPDDIRVVIHPQIIIHSMGVCSDASVLAQLGPPDDATDRIDLEREHIIAHPDQATR